MEKSDRQIAVAVKASPTTVGTTRRKLEDTGEVSKLDTRTGADGVKQPASKPTLPPKLKKPVAEARADTLMQLSVLLNLDSNKMLDEIVRMFRDARSAIQALPREKRVGIARGILNALDLGHADLQTIG